MNKTRTKSFIVTKLGCVVYFGKVATLQTRVLKHDRNDWRALVIVWFMNGHRLLYTEANPTM